MSYRTTSERLRREAIGAPFSCQVEQVAKVQAGTAIVIGVKKIPTSGRIMTDRMRGGDVRAIDDDLDRIVA